MHSSHSFSKTLVDSVDKVIDLMEKSSFPLDIWGYYNSVWAMRKETNVLLQHFSDLKADPAGCNRRLAKFLEVECSEELLSKVTELTSFSWMKKNESKFSGKTRLGFEKADGTLIPIAKPDAIFLRKGEVSEHLTCLSESQRKRIFRIAENMIDDPDCLSWVFYGTHQGKLNCENETSLPK